MNRLIVINYLILNEIFSSTLKVFDQILDTVLAELTSVPPPRLLVLPSRVVPKSLPAKSKVPPLTVKLALVPRPMVLPTSVAIVHLPALAPKVIWYWLLILVDPIKKLPLKKGALAAKSRKSILV